MDDCKQCSDSNAGPDSTAGVNLPGNQSTGRRGRRVTSQSRAAEIRSKLLAWKQTPELQRISLRSLAVELGTSHQLLGSYLRSLNKWQAKDYKRRAEEIRNLAWAENRRLTPWEESRAEALDRAAFQCMIESALTHALRRFEKELFEGKCRAGSLKLVTMLARRGFQALRKYSKSTNSICRRSKSGILSPLDATEARLATPLKGSLMPSREASLRNLARARANWRPPRPWRSRSESRLIRSFVWHWCLGRGPWCSGRALARWLGVSHTYVQRLTRTLSRNENDFLREVARYGIPTVEGLISAREESRQQRERGLLRTQRR